MLLERRLQQGGVGLFAKVVSDRTWRNVLKLCQGRFRLDIRKNFFMVRNWSEQLRAVMELPSVEVFKRCVYVALRDMVKWQDLVGQTGGWTSWSWRFFPTYFLPLWYEDRRERYSRKALGHSLLCGCKTCDGMKWMRETCCSCLSTVSLARRSVCAWMLSVNTAKTHWE